MTELAIHGGLRVVAADQHTRWPIVTQTDREAVDRVLQRGVLSGMFAPEAVALERAFARFVGARSAQLTHSGTSALSVALAAAGVGEGHEVIVPAYSFVATPLSVLNQGAIPIFVDVDPMHGNIDVTAIEEAVSPRTRAIMPVHVHGCPCDLAEVLAIAAERDLVVIEDAAQAHGATYRGSPVGALGTAGAFSLQSSKNLSGGEGGLLVTNDPSIEARAREIRSFGQDVRASDADAYDPARPLDGHRPLYSSRLGAMSRGNEMMAALVLAQLARLPEATARCRANVDRLRSGIADLPGLFIPSTPSDRESAHHKVRLHFDVAEAGLAAPPIDVRALLLAALRAEGLEVVLWQTEPLPRQPVFRSAGFGRGFPWTIERPLANYSKRFPATTALLEGSVVLFSQSCPLIAQTDELVTSYIEAIRKVWAARHRLLAS